MNDIDTLELRAFLNKHIEQTDSELAKDILKKEKELVKNVCSIWWNCQCY